MGLQRVYQRAMKPFRWPVLEKLQAFRTGRIDKDDPLQFMAFAAPLAPQSKSQIFQDLWALWETHPRTGGFFVEIGANDGVTHSNTYLLEKLGWSGIVAEPNPALSDCLRENRACHVSTSCLYPRSGEEATFLIPDESQLSRLADYVPTDSHERKTRRAPRATVKVPTISLNDLLATASAPKTIDYLSIDTEGSELAILETFDFSAWDVRAISVEHNYTAARGKLHRLLTANGLRRKWPEISRFDDWYVRSR